MYYLHDSGKILKLVNNRESGINTYLEVDQNFKPILKKRDWSCRPEDQKYIIKGFEKLKKLKTLSK